MDRRRLAHFTRRQRRRNLGPGPAALWQRHTRFHGIRRRRPENAQGSQEVIRSTAAGRNFALREMSIFERLRKRKKINTSDDENHYKHSNRRTDELPDRQTQSA